jgi:micrococcal nuclease
VSCNLIVWTLRRTHEARHQRRVKAVFRHASGLAAAAIVGLAASVEASQSPGAAAPGAGETVSACRVVDGDTLRCGSERIRLLGIDAPELPGHCRPSRLCAPGDPYASTSSLEEAMGAEMEIERVGEDRYGRTLEVVSGPNGDLSCWQLRHHQAIYKAQWDDGLRIARTCPKALGRCEVGCREAAGQEAPRIRRCR